MSIAYHEYRCDHCRKLFFKGLLVEGEIEVKCKHCHEVSLLKSSRFNELLCLTANCPNRVSFQKPG